MSLGVLGSNLSRCFELPSRRIGGMSRVFEFASRSFHISSVADDIRDAIDQQRSVNFLD
jgi:hypothetical protein